jgi:hypothetical protein
LNVTERTEQTYSLLVAVVAQLDFITEEVCDDLNGLQLCAKDDFDELHNIVWTKLECE